MNLFNSSSCAAGNLGRVAQVPKMGRRRIIIHPLHVVSSSKKKKKKETFVLELLHFSSSREEGFFPLWHF